MKIIQLALKHGFNVSARAGLEPTPYNLNGKSKLKDLLKIEPSYTIDKPIKLYVDKAVITAFIGKIMPQFVGVSLDRLITINFAFPKIGSFNLRFNVTEGDPNYNNSHAYLREVKTPHGTVTSRGFDIKIMTFMSLSDIVDITRPVVYTLSNRRLSHIKSIKDVIDKFNDFPKFINIMNLTFKKHIRPISRADEPGTFDNVTYRSPFKSTTGLLPVIEFKYDKGNSTVTIRWKAANKNSWQTVRPRIFKFDKELSQKQLFKFVASKLDEPINRYKMNAHA